MTLPVDMIVDVCRRLRVQPYLVGGSVRDRLLNVPSHDWDLVCADARKVAAAVARRLSRKLITLDEQHRIYRIVLPAQQDLRPVTLDFAEMQGGNIEIDLARRDFTINAMALSLMRSAERGARKKESLFKVTSFRAPTSEFRADVIDPLGGQKDLNKKVVRALSRKAFIEDPLRLLRAYRMAAQFGFQIEPRTRTWIRQENHRLEDPRGVARERVREELLRLLSQPTAGEVVKAMDGSGLLTTLFPELEAGRRVALDFYGRGGVIKHQLDSVVNVDVLLERLDQGQLGFISQPTILDKMRIYVAQSVSGWPRRAFLKLAALLHDLGKPATAELIQGRLRFFGHEDVGARMVQKLLEGMRFSRQEGSMIRSWVQNHMRPGSLASAPQLTDKAVARFFRDLGEDGVGMVLVSLGDHYTYLAKTKWGKGTDPVEQTSRRLLEAYYLKRERVLPPKLLDGHRLMKTLRLKPGPVIGQLLEAVRDAQAEGTVKTVEEALVLAKNSLGELKIANTKKKKSK